MGIYNKYPYTDFHELNLDWFLEEFKKVTDKVTDLESIVNQFTEFVTNYFDDLDAQALVNARLNEMTEDGTLAGLLSPLITDPVNAWMDSHITQSTDPVIDGSLRIGNAAAESSIVGASLIDGNVCDMASLITKANKTQAQVTYTWSDDGLTLTTTGTSSATTWFDFYNGLMSAAPFEPGRMYRFVGTGLGYMHLRLYCYDGPDPDTANLTSARNWTGDCDNYFIIPNDTQYFICRVWASGNTNCNNASIKIKIYSDPTDHDQIIFNTFNYGNYGTSALVTKFTNCDSVDINSTIFISTISGSPELAGFPFTHPGWLVTILDGDLNTIKTQIALPYNTADKPLYRICQNGTWTDWQSGTSGNNAAKLLIYGNSILNGSVWQSGSFSHLAPYDSAPYGMIANALNVPAANVDNHLLSSTGLLYDAGEGSFYSNIMAINDFSDYAAVITHAWFRDLENFSITQITNAITAIIDHIRLTNPNCQLIIISPPPVNYVAGKSGNDVFTGAYTNGSIADLDSALYAINETSKAHNFIYADWQGLYLSYIYQTVTDGNNVHGNSDAVYRILGSWIAGQLASKITF